MFRQIKIQEQCDIQTFKVERVNDYSMDNYFTNTVAYIEKFLNSGNKITPVIKREFRDLKFAIEKSYKVGEISPDVYKNVKKKLSDFNDKLS